MLMKTHNRQMGGFALTSLACLLCGISMKLPQWQVWYYEDPVISKPTMAFVGIWKTCVFHNGNNSSDMKICHQYNYRDSFIPFYMQINQHLLLVTIVFVVFGKITTIITLWILCMGKVWRNVTCNLFRLSGILKIIASSLLFLTVLLNYISIMCKWGVAFPPSFNMPSDPDTQKIGSAMILAIMSAVSFLISGTICLPSNLAIVETPCSKI
ncbi:claudin-34-like [Chionomys nivalis]|uniref:claudin-34-like n=1 Tax=Chionomys nivalis TaxID=269649 RepID=UPI00259349C8|nr:claudin-34-like [Chionomys nivalis]